jgi:hypothetical protein
VTIKAEIMVNLVVRSLLILDIASSFSFCWSRSMSRYKGSFIQLCSLLKAFNTHRSVEESLAISLDDQKHFMVVANIHTTLTRRYVDGVSLIYGSPRQHIWTFANELDEYP